MGSAKGIGWLFHQSPHDRLCVYNHRESYLQNCMRNCYSLLSHSVTQLNGNLSLQFCNSFEHFWKMKISHALLECDTQFLLCYQNRAINELVVNFSINYL